MACLNEQHTLEATGIAVICTGCNKRWMFGEFGFMAHGAVVIEYTTIEDDEILTVTQS